MTAAEKLNYKISSNKHIAVGIDPDIKKIPKHLLSEKDPLLKFNEIIIESTYEHAASYKLNFAFFEKFGDLGFKTLEKTLDLIPKDILAIADAKRGDIGNTSKMYAEAVFEHLNFDAVTLHPYMGFDSIEPFIEYKDKLSFILALTSNKGSSDFEKLKLENGKFLFQEVITKINKWNINNNLGLVFGATNSIELKENIDNFNDMPILLPGIGAQGGSLEETVFTFKNLNKNNFIINVSRSLIYADSGKDFNKSVENEIINLNNRIEEFLAK